MINRRRVIKAGKKYIDFADEEVKRVCCVAWGDYYVTTTTDNGDNTVTVTTGFVSKMNGSVKRNRVISKEVLDNTDGKYIAGTTYEAVGMTLLQCKSVTNIGTQFKDNSKIRTFNEFQYFTGITSLAVESFRGSGISDITFPHTITTIKGSSFINCNNLKSIKLNEGVKTIENQWIWGCHNLTLIDIPSTVTLLNGYGIQNYNSSNPKPKYNVICRAINPPTLGSSNYTNELVKIYVPDESIDLYKTANVWKNLANKIVGISTYGG